MILFEAGLVQWAILLWGVVYLITEATLTAPFRIWFAKGSTVRALFVYCSACVGFWAGLFLGALHYWPFATGWLAVAESGIAALAAGRIWGRISDNRATLETELEHLNLVEASALYPELERGEETVRETEKAKADD